MSHRNWTHFKQQRRTRRTARLQLTILASTPHHHPLPIEGCPQPTRSRSRMVVGCGCPRGLRRRVASPTRSTPTRAPAPSTLAPDPPQRTSRIPPTDAPQPTPAPNPRPCHHHRMRYRSPCRLCARVQRLFPYSRHPAHRRNARACPCCAFRRRPRPRPRSFRLSHLCAHHLSHPRPHRPPTCVYAHAQ